MDIREQLRLLQTAEGDPARLALATVDLAFPTLGEGERTELKTALEAASIPHWCDAQILAALLEIPVEASRERLARLRRLKVVEPFPARGDHAVNVHEAARLALRRWLAARRAESFRAWSQRAADHFAADPAPAARIEWIYHRLSCDPDRAATELECLDRDWSSSARPEDRQALAIALWELLEADVLDGRARVWAMLCVAWAHDARGETAQLGDQARAILDLAADTRDQTAIAEAQCLIGDVFQAQGKLNEAEAAFGEYLAICWRLAEQDPSNTYWQKNVAVAHSRVGDVFEAQGKLNEAQAAFGEYLAICRRLAEQDRNNVDWQRDLAVAHSKVGDVIRTQGKLSEAQAAFGESLAIFRLLANQDPSNAAWQRDLAAMHSRVGDVLKAQGKLNEAQAAVGEDLAISRRLAEQDPGNAGWQWDLAVAHSRVGDVFQAQGNLNEAQAAFGESLAICRRLAEQDPSNAAWQRDLALGCWRVASLLNASGSSQDALLLYEEAARIFVDLVERCPDFPAWSKERDTVQRELAVCRINIRRPP